MKITYTLAPDDLHAWQSYYLKHFAPVWQRYNRLLGVGVFFFLFLFFLLPSLPEEGSVIGIVAGAIVGLSVIAFGLFRKGGVYARAMDRQIKNNPIIVGYREAKFIEDALYFDTPKQGVHYKKGSFIDWRSTDSHEFFVMGRNIALIIPRRAFEEEQYLEFVVWAEDFMGRKQQLPASKKK